MNIILLIYVVGYFVIIRRGVAGQPYDYVFQEAYNIIDGECDNASDSDLVLNEHVIKRRMLNMPRKAIVTWYGDQRIYCLEVLNQSIESKDQTEYPACHVKEGGIGHRFITIDMSSPKDTILDFTIKMYAR